MSVSQVLSDAWGTIRNSFGFFPQDRTNKLGVSAIVIATGIVLGAIAFGAGCCGIWPLCVALGFISLIAIVGAGFALYINHPRV